MDMIVEFFCSCRWFSVSLGADDGEKIFFLGQIVEAVLFQADELCIDPSFFCLCRKIGSQFFGIAGLLLQKPAPEQLLQRCWIQCPERHQGANRDVLGVH